MKRIKDRMNAFWAKISCLKLSHDYGVYHKGALYVKACKRAIRELIGKKKRKVNVRQKSKKY